MNDKSPAHTVFVETHFVQDLLVSYISVVRWSDAHKGRGGGRNEFGPSCFASVYKNSISLLNSNKDFFKKIGTISTTLCITFAKETNACAEYRRVTFVTVLKHLIL